MVSGVRVAGDDDSGWRTIHPARRWSPTSITPAPPDCHSAPQARNLRSR